MIEQMSGERLNPTEAWRQRESVDVAHKISLGCGEPCRDEMVAGRG